MSTPKTVGFPRMENEIGEKRVFLPEFVHYLVGLGAKAYIEDGYGARSDSHGRLGERAPQQQD